MQTCERCQGNGEIVTNWERYLEPHDGDKGDEAVAECSDCSGGGKILELCIDCGQTATKPSPILNRMCQCRDDLSG